MWTFSKTGWGMRVGAGWCWCWMVLDGAGWGGGVVVGWAVEVVTENLLSFFSSKAREL